jgi:hypothetical protein
MKLVEDRWLPQTLLEALVGRGHADRHPRPVLPVKERAVVPRDCIGISRYQGIKRIGRAFGCTGDIAANET